METQLCERRQGNSPFYNTEKVVFAGLWAVGTVRKEGFAGVSNARNASINIKVILKDRTN